jgi:hypothetical protein
MALFAGSYFIDVVVVVKSLQMEVVVFKEVNVGYGHVDEHLHTTAGGPGRLFPVPQCYVTSKRLPVAEVTGDEVTRAAGGAGGGDVNQQDTTYKMCFKAR